MSWIQNQSKGTFLFLSTKDDPAKASINLKSEIGKNAVVGPHHCRLVDDRGFKKNKHIYIAVVLKHQPGGQPVKWISQEIGPGQFWVFDGKRFLIDEGRSKPDSSVSLGG